MTNHQALIVELILVSLRLILLGAMGGLGGESALKVLDSGVPHNRTVVKENAQ